MRRKWYFPKSVQLKGHRAAYLLRPETEGDIELLVLTLWDSMEAIRRFAGLEPDKAVIEPQRAKTLLSKRIRKARTRKGK
jgi:heme-degrading monooxygenase HmoA